MFTRAVWVLFKSVNRQSMSQKAYFMQNAHSCQRYEKAEEQYKETIPVPTTKEFSYNHLAKSNDGMTDEEKREFMAVWPEVRETFVNVCTDVPKFKEFYTMLMEENIPKNKQQTGTLVVSTYKAFTHHHDKIDSHTIKIANILSWCVNMCQNVFMIVDDIMDGAETRFGLPSWYKRKDVGLGAILEAIAIENGVFKILEKYLKGRICHPAIVECFHEANLKTSIGMRMDMSTSLDGGNTNPLETFSPEFFSHFAILKGSSTISILPVSLGLYLADIYDVDIHKLAKAFANECGLYVMSQNDVTECFGNPAVTGKNPTDFTLGKCTWVAVQAVARATPAQNKLLFENYGKCDEESLSKVRCLFDEMKLLEVYLKHEEDSFKKCCQYIEQFPKFVNKEYLFRATESFYRRKYDRKI